MAESIPLGPRLQARFGDQAYGRADSIPWTIWCMFAGIACGLVGGQWDNFLAPVDRPRHVLDTGAHSDPTDGSAGGHRVRVHDPDGDVRRRYRDTKQVGEDLGIPRAAGSVYRDVGLHRDADLRAVR